MAEKRFELIYGASAIKDTLTGTEYDDFNPVGVDTDIHKICELLNDFAEENEQLKHDASILVQANKEYRVENEQLKQKILDEIDLEIAYINEVYSDGRMSIHQYDGAIICLQELRRKFE